MLRTATALAAFCLGLLGVAAATVAPPPAAPSALSAAIAATAAARTPYTFDIDVNSSKLNWRMHFSPQTTPHLQLVSPPRASLAHDQQQAFDQAARQPDGLSWCASAFMGHVTVLQLTHEDATSATYGFQPTPESIRSQQARRFAAQLRGEFTLSKVNPDITSVHIFAPAPFSPMLLTQINHLDIVTTCAPAPNGRMFAAQTVTQVAGSALGQAFNEQSVQRVHGLVAP